MTDSGRCRVRWCRLQKSLLSSDGMLAGRAHPAMAGFQRVLWPERGIPGTNQLGFQGNAVKFSGCQSQLKSLRKMSTLATHDRKGEQRCTGLLPVR